MSIDVKLEQIANAPISILVTVLGMSIDVKLEHEWNASKPILVTVLGMNTDVISVLFLNALVPILEYPSIITVVAVPIFALTVL